MVPSHSRDSAKSQSPYDLVCLAHLRWDFVYQRPQHLLMRCARERRVFYVEEPLFEAEAEERPYLHIREVETRLWVVTPHLPLNTVDRFLSRLSWDATWNEMRQLIDPIASSRSDWLPYSVGSSSALTFSGDTLLPGGSV